MRKQRNLFLAGLCALFATGCGSMKINLVTDYSEPLQEYTIEGQGINKILVVPVNGMISDIKTKTMMQSKPSLLQEVVAHLNKASKDPYIKGIVLKVNSPGGTVTASDLLYHEIVKFKQETNLPVVVCMMGMATSGGYYVSLPADHIIAHPTTVTGSVGVVFMRPKFNGLMGKLGLDMEISKSGRNKDMGSPFRPTTEEEQKLFQGLIDNMAGIFKSKVVKHRTLSDKALKDVLSAKVYVADDALKNGLIDQIGFIDNAIDKTKEFANLSGPTRTVVYRREEYANDNIYNDSTAQTEARPAMIDLGPLNPLASMKPGFYYVWAPAAE